jgi:3-oxoadipate enol-lactonase
MPKIKANEITIYYEESGAGEPVLFISGTGGDLRAKPNVLDGPLAGARRVIAYDQRGLGQTDKPEVDYTMADYADDAAALLDALQLPAADVIGISFGGMVALHLALRHPQRVKKLVLGCTSPGGELASYPFHELSPDLTTSERLLTLMPINDTRRSKSWQQDNPDTVEKMIAYAEDQVIADHSTAEFKAGARRQLLARADHNVVAELREITMPTLICAGKYDGIAPAENQHALVQGIPESELRWYEGGHLFLIQDKQAWQDIIAFLK